MTEDCAMRRSTRILIAAIPLLFAACSVGGGAPAASITPSPDPAAGTYWLRMTTSQAIAPLELFGRLPVLVITGDGVAVTPGPMMAIYPGPLLPPLIGRRLTETGRAEIVNAARDLGLLDGQADFTEDLMIAGGETGRIELTVDGRRVSITGDPGAQIECITTPCVPAPGTSAAFGDLWRQLSDLGGWLRAELGPEIAYTAPAYSLLVRPATDAMPDLPQSPVVWPLDTPLAAFGTSVANGTARCGTVDGADARTIRQALATANTLTPWIQEPGSAEQFGITVRPLVPGEDACAEVFGPA
jgi:hypothetical protein